MCAHSHWAKDGSGIILNDSSNNRNGTKHRRQEALVINKAKKVHKSDAYLACFVDSVDGS